MISNRDDRSPELPRTATIPVRLREGPSTYNSEQRALCPCRKRNNFGRHVNIGRKAHTLRLGNTVLAPQVAVGFHCERAAVFVSQPARNSRNVHTCFNASRCKQMP